MRISRQRGRRLHSVVAPKRPTSDRVKEALFNIIGPRVIDALFLDLFAGNGGIGVEALSRGAEGAVFIDKNNRCTQTIKQNLEITSFLLKSHIITGTLPQILYSLGKKNAQYNIIFLDPPYGNNLVSQTLQSISENQLLFKDGLVICEYGFKEEIPKLVLNLNQVRTVKYGDTVLGFYRLGGL